VVNVEGNAKPAALLEGKLDGIESFDFLQVPLFEANGLPVSTLTYAQAGINVPGLSLVTANEMIQKNPALDPDWAKGRPFGWMSPAVMERSQDLLMQYGGLKVKRPIEDYFTNEFIPAS